MGSKTRQEVSDELAQGFPVIPQLERLVFPDEPHQRAVQVLIVRGELGVSGRAAIMDPSVVDAAFFNLFSRYKWSK